MAVWCSGYDTCLSPGRSGFNSPNEQQQDILLFFPLRPFLSLPFSLPSQGNFPISFKPKVAIAKPLFLQQRLLKQVPTYIRMRNEGHQLSSHQLSLD